MAARKTYLLTLNNKQKILAHNRKHNEELKQSHETYRMRVIHAVICRACEKEIQIGEQVHSLGNRAFGTKYYHLDCARQKNIV